MGFKRTKITATSTQTPTGSHGMHEMRIAMQQQEQEAAEKKKRKKKNYIIRLSLHITASISR